MMPASAKPLRPTFAQLSAAGFTSSIVPIIAPDATLHPDTRVIPSQKGKIPGRYSTRDRAWFGYRDWTELRATPEQIAEWDAWPNANIGLQTRDFPAIDFDCDDAALAAAVRNAAVMVLGPAPVRHRGSTRFALVYRLAPGETLKKIRVAFRLPGAKDGDEPNAVEILGAGQQIVVYGRHKSGKDYLWSDFAGRPTRGLLDETATGLTEIDAATLERFASEDLPRMIGAAGGIVVTLATQRASGVQTTRFKIGHHALMAADPRHIREALEILPNDMTYDQWVQHVAAIKAAFGGDEGDEGENYAAYEEWCLKYEQNTPEIVRQKWDSIHESAIGADYIFQRAAQHGFNWGAVEFDVVDEDDAPEISETAAWTKAKIDASGDALARLAAKDGARWCIKADEWEAFDVADFDFTASVTVAAAVALANGNGESRYFRAAVFVIERTIERDGPRALEYPWLKRSLALAKKHAAVLTEQIKATALAKGASTSLFDAALRDGKSALAEPKKRMSTVLAGSALATPDALKTMNDSFFASHEGGKTFIVKEYDDPQLGGMPVLQFFRMDDMRTLYSNRVVKVGEDDLVPLVDWWMKHPHRRSYENGILLIPNSDVPEGVYNLWRGYGVKAKKGDWGLYRNHLQEIICAGNREHYEYLIRWMANAVQHPDRAGQVAVVILGGKGSGKGTAIRLFGRLFGSHFLHVSDSESLVGRFNDHLRSTVLLFADEAFFAGDKRHESALKRLVTEPTLHIEGKFKNAITAPNYLHIMMASNKDWVVPATADERRYFVIQTDNSKARDTSYFERIIRQMEDQGGLQALLYDLLNMDLTSFNIWHYPDSEALAMQMRLTMEPHEEYLLDRVRHGVLPGLIEKDGEESIVSSTGAWPQSGECYVDKRAMYDAFCEWHHAHVKGRARAIPESLFFRHIYSLLGIPQTKSTRPSVSGKRMRVVAMPGLDAAESALEKKFGQGLFDEG